MPPEGANAMEGIDIAIIGLGPGGLAALKTLREEGFNAVAFERRDRVGGLWSFSPNPVYTSVIDETVCNSSKFISGFSDFPIPKDAPAYLSGAQAAAYFASYAEHFELYPHIRFGTTVTKVLRNAADDGWNLHITTRDGQPQVLAFHKFVLASGSDSHAVWPAMPGRALFRGTVLHSQEYKGPEPFASKRVLVVGLGNTGCDTAVSLATRAAAVHHAYRSGRMMISRYDDTGVPFDAGVPWPMLQLKYQLDDWVPWLMTPLVDALLERKMVADVARTEPPGADDDDGHDAAARYRRAARRVRRDLHLHTGPSFVHRPPAVQEDWIPAVRRGAVVAAPAAGFRAFVGPNAVALDDGTILSDIDAVVFCTGYALDWRMVPELAANDDGVLPGDDDGGGGVPHVPRLYHLIFPPRWADSAAVLSYVAPRENVWAFCELASMAVAQLWASATADARPSSSSSPPSVPGGPATVPARPPARFPSRAAMEAAVDADHAWWRRERAREPRLLAGTARSAAALTRFLHDAAGTGVMERHAYGGAGPWGALSRWWRRAGDEDAAVAAAVARGPANAYIWRLWDTNPAGVPGCGRRAWPGAREAVLNAYAEYEDFKKTKMAEKTAAAAAAEST